MIDSKELAKQLGLAKDYPRLLAEVNELIRIMAPRAAKSEESPENYQWFGRVQAVIAEWDGIEGVKMGFAIQESYSNMLATSSEGWRKVVGALHYARADLMLKTDTSPTVVVEKGGVHDYFDEVRKIIETAAADLFFIDPYLDADFVSKYLPHVKNGVSVRLLAQKKPQALVAAVSAWTQQHGGVVQVRANPNMHDRFVIVDKRDVYSSSGSFKDGARNASTVLSEQRDGGPTLMQLYEGLWAGAPALL